MTRNLTINPSFLYVQATGMIAGGLLLTATAIPPIIVKTPLVNMNSTQTQFEEVGQKLRHTALGFGGLSILGGMGTLAYALSNREADDDEDQFDLFDKAESISSPPPPHPLPEDEEDEEDYEEDCEEKENEPPPSPQPHHPQYLQQQDALALAEYWQAVNGNGEVEATATTSPPKEESLFDNVGQVEPPELFDWQELAIDYNSYPHIRIVGPSGNGKTKLAENIANLLGDRVTVFGPKREPQDWEKMRFIGEGRDFQRIADSIQRIIDEDIKRDKEKKKKPSGYYLQPENRFLFIFDDAQVIFQTEYVKPLIRAWQDLISLSRAQGIRLLLIATTDNAVGSGVQGMADAKKNFLTIYMGEQALTKAHSMLNVRSKDTQYQNYWNCAIRWLETQGKYKCLVEGQKGVFVAKVPKPNEF